MKFNGVEVPDHGGIITKEGDGFVIPDKPIIPFIEGDGTGRDIWKASRMVFDAAVQKVQRTEQREVCGQGRHQPQQCHPVGMHDV